MRYANAVAQAAVLPRIPPELLDKLVKGPMSAQAVDEASREFKKALIERALGAGMSHHLGYPAGGARPVGSIAIAGSARKQKCNRQVIRQLRSLFVRYTNILRY
jgi:transposase-like protein